MIVARTYDLYSFLKKTKNVTLTWEMIHLCLIKLRYKQMYQNWLSLPWHCQGLSLNDSYQYQLAI